MKFISVRDREAGRWVWRELSEVREMVVTSNGRPVAILAAVNESNLEESLAAFRRARAVDAASRLQRESLAQGLEGLSSEEIEAEIAVVRRRRTA